MANIIHLGGAFSIVILSALAGFIVFRTQRHHKAKQAEEAEKLEHVATLSEEELITNSCIDQVGTTLRFTKEMYNESIQSTIDEDVRALRKIEKSCVKQIKKVERLKADIYLSLPRTDIQNEEKDILLYHITDHLWESALSIQRMVSPLHNHVENNHKTFNAAQKQEISALKTTINAYFSSMNQLAESRNIELFEKVTSKHDELLEVIRKIRKNQLKRLKSEKEGTKVSLLFSDMLHETISIIEYTYGLTKSYTNYLKDKI